MPNVNLLAVLLCGLSSMVLGAIWYSPLLFARRWQAGAKLSDSDLAGVAYRPNDLLSDTTYNMQLGMAAFGSGPGASLRAVANAGDRRNQREAIVLGPQRRREL